MKIRILAVGSLKESYWRDAVSEYRKRISGYAEILIEEVADIPEPKQSSLAIEQSIKEKEGEKLLSKIKPNDFVCLMDLVEEQPDSMEFSKKLEKMLERGGASITFVIGGSLGLGEDIRARANARLALSKMTFTHQLTRVLLLEQIYRAFRILRNEPYSK